MNTDSDLECIFHEHTKKIIYKAQKFQVSPKLLNINEHIPLSYAYYIKCAFGSLLKIIKNYI